MTDRAARIRAVIYLVVVLGSLFSLAAVPGVTLANLADGFRWRKDLIRAFSSFRYAVGDRLFNDTLVGKDGWLFYTGGLSIREYQQTDDFGQTDLKTFQKDLDQLNSALAAQGRTLVLVIPPNKTSIYPQYMPGEIQIIGHAPRTDQFMGYMLSHSATRILDLRSALLRPSAAQQTYYRTDSHWNDLGGYYGYYEIVSLLARDYPNLNAHPLSDYTQTILPTRGGTDLPGLMGYLSISEDDPVLEPRFPFSTTTVTTTLADGLQMRVTTNQRTDLPKVLVFGDSFYEALEKFLKPDFGKVVDLPYFDAAGDSLNYWVQLEQPDIVMLECAERDLGNLFPLLHSIER